MPKRHGNDDPRGNAPKKSGMLARMNYGNTGQGTRTAEWGIASPIALQRLITTVTDQGGAILLGYSRDRGSYRIIIMDGDDKVTKWIPCTTDIDEAIEDLTGQLWPGDIS